MEEKISKLLVRSKGKITLVLNLKKLLKNVP